ncbi:MAG TPA: SpoIIE family protein phosphatase [Thermoanaerobaculia bacterium]|nr:SpoIIE family protein phosphatase [Thermoanaerobaculia bacterium]
MTPRQLLVHIARTGATAVAIGLVFSSIYAIGRPDAVGRLLVLGAITGICIATVIGLLNLFVETATDRLAPAPRIVAKSLMFIVGGTTGWSIGMLLGSALLGVGMSPKALVRGEGLIMLGLVGGIALAVGLAFYAYELLQRRLERTIQQLKEAEWAEKEIELARSIQTRLLPPAEIDGDGYTISARNLPAQLVAGDFYDVVRLDDGSVVIVVADVAGKGLGASLIMASVKAVLPFVARESPQRAMSMLNEKLVGELGRREFVALVYARFQPADGALEILNAGFPEPYVVGRDGVRMLSGDGERLPLGIRGGITYEPLRARLERGERLVFVSDGIPEAPANGEPIGYERVAEILRGLGRAALGRSDLPAEGGPHHTFIDLFLDAVRAHVEPVLADDWTAVVVTRA